MSRRAHLSNDNDRHEAGRPTYATKAKVEHAIRMARLAEIDSIGCIELGPDGTIRIWKETEGRAPAPATVEDEIAAWRSKRGKS